MELPFCTELIKYNVTFKSASYTVIFVYIIWGYRSKNFKEHLLLRSTFTLFCKLQDSVKIYWASLVAQWWRIHLQCMRRGFDPWIGKIPWRTIWQFTLVFLPGKSHRPKSLANYSPWGRKRVRPSLMTKQKQHKIQQYLQDNINILNELKIHSSVKWNTR